MTESGYNEGQIQVLEGRDAVRKRPGMYIGSTDKAGLHHLLWEITDNSIDEFMAGHASTIRVTLHEDGRTIEVDDDGRGIPVGKESSTGLSALEVVFTKLHAGGKFDKGAYKGSGGLHGVGASVTNFLSEFLTAEVRREEKVYAISFEQGIITKPLEEIGTYSKFSAHHSSGTKVLFKPDAEIFPECDFDAALIRERLEIKTYINPGLKIVFEDRKGNTTETFEHPDGITAYVKKIVKSCKTKALHDVIVIKGEQERGDKMEFEIVLQWTEDTAEACESFINSIPTKDGGTHELGYKEGLLKAMRGYLDTSDQVPKRLDIKPEDIREGLKAVVNVFFEGELQFQSQNKVRLNNPEIKPAIANGVKTQLEQFLFSNSSTADLIVKRIVASAKARMASRAVTNTLKNKAKSAKKITLPGKLADCSSDKPEECEIFLVEGDSAGGSAKMGRLRETQAILPLRGKVLNTEGTDLKKIIANKELWGIVEALGCGIGPTFDVDNLRYHKIILLMDADSDGHHITTLLLTFFYRHMPELIEGGYVYLAQPPLYRIQWGQEQYWALTDGEKDGILKSLEKKGAVNVEVSRFKGLGEMMADTLAETTLNPDTRVLIQVEIPDHLEDETSEVISDLMGNDASRRYEMITNNLNLLDDLDV